MRRGKETFPSRQRGKEEDAAMGLLQLIPLLASLPIILLQGSPTDLPPPPPDIAVTPEKREYLIGDTVSIRCSAPRSRDKVRGFQFSRTGGWLDVRTAWRTYTYTFNVTGPKDGGSHTCTYTVGDRYRQARRSRESRAVDINVRDPPPQPTLVLNASAGVVSEGFPLLFLCTAPASAAEAAPPRFRFYKDGAEAIGGAEVATQGHQARLRVAESSRNHTGNFTCGYEEHIEGRWILSFLSEAVEVFVKEPPSAPRLGVEPPFTVLSEDSPLRLTCLAPGAGSRLRFRFYRNGVEIPEGSPGPKNLPGTTPGGSSELLVPQTPRGFGGTFSCGFEEDVGGTWVPSPRSQALDITVKDLPGPPGLLLDPPSGEVRAGDTLAVTCAANGTGGGERRFYFYKDGAEQFSEAGARDRALLSLPVAKSTAGSFSCRYEERVGDRWVPSPLSHAAVVTVRAAALPVPLVAGCGAAAAALLLGLLLAVCYCQRRRGRAHWKGLYNKEDPSTYPMTGVDRSEP